MTGPFVGLGQWDETAFGEPVAYVPETLRMTFGDVLFLSALITFAVFCCIAWLSARASCDGRKRFARLALTLPLTIACMLPTRSMHALEFVGWPYAILLLLGMTTAAYGLVCLLEWTIRTFRR